MDEANFVVGEFLAFCRSGLATARLKESRAYVVGGLGGNEQHLLPSGKLT